MMSTWWAHGGHLLPVAAATQHNAEPDRFRSRHGPPTDDGCVNGLRARAEIHNVELLIALAQSLGGDPGDASEPVRPALEKHVLARTAVGWGQNTTAAFTVWCSDLAIGAIRPTREAIALVRLPKA